MYRNVLISSDSDREGAHKSYIVCQWISNVGLLCITCLAKVAILTERELKSYLSRLQPQVIDNTNMLGSG